MNNQKAMIELIKATSGQANVLSIPRPYIKFMGSLDGGLFLSQVIFWSDRGSQSDGWFYKTYAEWESELTLSKYEVSKQVKILKEKGLLKTKVKKAHGAPTVHYKFSFDEFQKSFVKFLHYGKSRNLTIESEETSQSITETTTETTTNMPQSGADDFSDLFGGSQADDQITKPQKTKRDLTDAERAHFQTFGVLPDQDVNPTEYAIRQEILSANWDIYHSDVQTAIIYFVIAVREHYPNFDIPKDTSTRKLWYQSISNHLQNYSLEKLQTLYKQAIIKMTDANLSFWQPGSLTKWALPEATHQSDKQSMPKNHVYNPSLTPEQKKTLERLRQQNAPIK